MSLFKQHPTKKSTIHESRRASVWAGSVVAIAPVDQGRAQHDKRVLIRLHDLQPTTDAAGDIGIRLKGVLQRAEQVGEKTRYVDVDGSPVFDREVGPFEAVSTIDMKSKIAELEHVVGTLAWFLIDKGKNSGMFLWLVRGGL